MRRICFLAHSEYWQYFKVVIPILGLYFGCSNKVPQARWHLLSRLWEVCQYSIKVNGNFVIVKSHNTERNAEKVADSSPV